jgi:hypothetical protein
MPESGGSMSWIKDTVRGLMPKPQPPAPEKATWEQMKDVVDQAEEFDRLQALPVWEKILGRLALGMNAELVEASNKKYDRELRMMHCDMYHAKREALDDLQGWIEATQRERDRIIEEFKGARNGYGGINGNGV